MVRQRFTLLITALLLTCCWANAQQQKFEGELIYENTVTTNKTMRKLYPNLFKDGTYDMQYVIKGDLKKMSDTYAGLVQYECKSKDTGYLVCPLLKRGYRYKLSQYRMQQEDQFRNWGGNSGKRTGEVKEVEGLECQHYKNRLQAKEGNGECTVDYWVCRDFESEFIGLAKLEGLPVEVDYIQTMSLPLIGTLKQHQSITLTGSKRRVVDDEEMNPPSDYDYYISEDLNATLIKLEKEIFKYMKKNHLEDAGVKIYHGKTDDPVLDDAWD